MKSPRFKGLLLLLFAATFFTACQKELPPVEDSLTYIPEDAAMVTAIRLQQLMDKANFESLKQTKGFQNMLEDAAEENAMLAKVLADPAASGIDLSKNMYVSVELSDSEPLMTLASFSIADAEALEQMMEGLEVEASPVNNDFKYFDTPGKAAVAWNDEVLLLGMVDESISVKDRLLRYLETPADASVAGNTNLREQLQGDFDILNWLSSDFILRSRDWQTSGNLLNYDKEELSGQYVAHALTFEEGVIENKVMLDLSGRLKNDLGMFFRDEVTTDFITAAPAGTPAFLLTAAFDINGVNQLLVEKYSKGVAEKTLNEFGLSAKELLKAFSGDIMLAGYESPKGAALFAAAVEDEAPLRTLLDKATEDNKLEQLSDNRYRFLRWEREAEGDSSYVKTSIEMDGEVLLHEGLFFIANQPALLDQIEAGNTGLSGELAKQSAQAMGEHIFTAFGNPALMSAFDFEAEQIQEVEASADREGIQLRLEMDNQELNSLRYLIELMEKEQEEAEL
ncbi:MAG TPA: DUF4836 family protein [Phaeodactylibacter sp.]|nr:DUF4836 family protein [Phaeodactylibacter sp.]